MRFALHQTPAGIGVLASTGDAWHETAGLGLPFDIRPAGLAALAADRLSVLGEALRTAAAPGVDLKSVTLLPPIAPEARIFCVGLNYADHADESKMDKTAWPVLFLRTYESFVGSGVPLRKPRMSEAFDYEGEMVAVLSRGGRHLDLDAAAKCVGGYSVANEGSVRDYQLKHGPQWTMGKNFHQSGAMGPWLVTADEVSPAGRGLAISTRLNGEVVQSSNTSNLIFGLAEVISYLSQAVVLRAGDVIVSGTPSGVGAARTPPLWMKAGDTVEVELETVGCLRNPIAAE